MTLPEPDPFDPLEPDPFEPEPVEPEKVKDDPKRPWKAIAAAVAAAASAGIAYATSLPELVVVALAMIGSFAATYAFRNPQVPDDS